MKTIVITGIDGSGKSTQTKLLKQSLNNAETYSVWDLIVHPDYRDWSIYQFPPPVEKYVINLNPVARTLFIFHAFDFAYEQALKSQADYVIFDAYWYKYLAVELAMGTNKNLIEFAKNRYLKPDFCFYLDMQIDELHNRKPKISAYESGLKDHLDYDNFIKIQKSAKTYLEGFLPENSLTISATKPIDEIHQIIMQNIDTQ